MLESKPLHYPVALGPKLFALDGEPLDNPHLYWCTVGRLQYLSLTWPNIAYAVSQVCQFMHKPSIGHWLVVKCILRYLKGAINFGLHFHPGSISSLHGFSDANWVGYPDDRRSVSGFLIYLGRNPISWSSKKQRTIARSSTECEYKSLANATSEIIWLQRLLCELGISIRHVPTLQCDNMFAIYLTANSMFHACTKHLEINYHFIHEQFLKKALAIHFINSYD